jgi:hypothetical protein
MSENRDRCFAPVFSGVPFPASLILIIIYVVVVILLILFIWVPGVACLIKQYVYRIQHISAGNANPSIPI